MLYALQDPLSFVVLVAAFVLACTLSGWVQVRLLPAGAALDDPRRRRPSPRAHLDPFACVAAAMTGVGWPRPVALPGRRPGVVALAGPAVLLAVGSGLLVAAGAVAGPLAVPVGVVQSGAPGLPPGEKVLLLAGMVHLLVGLLSLVPLPPLDGGRLLFARVPRTPGWDRAREYLVGRNLGTGAVLLLLVLPLSGRAPLLLAVLAAAAEPWVRLLTRAG